MTNFEIYNKSKIDNLFNNLNAECEQNIQNISSYVGKNNIIIDIKPNKSIYSITISRNTNISFTLPSELVLTDKLLRFELILNMSTTAYTLIFPSTVTWLEEPDFSETGKYIVVFRTYDGGTSWVGFVGGKF